MDLSENEVNAIFQGDSENEGFIQFRAIEKPVVITKSPTNVLPTQATLRVDVTSIGGQVDVISTVVDESFQGFYSWAFLPGIQLRT